MWTSSIAPDVVQTLVPLVAIVAELPGLPPRRWALAWSLPQSFQSLERTLATRVHPGY